MRDYRNQVVSIRALDIRSLAVMGLAFGLVASLVSLGILAYVLAGGMQWHRRNPTIAGFR